MRTAFSRQFSLMAGLMLLCFLMLGCSFTSLFYNYMLQERGTALSDAAQAIESYACTQDNLSEVNDWDFRLTVITGANASGTDVLICDTTGTVTVCSCDTFGCSHLGKTIPTAYIDALGSDDYIYTSGVLSNIYSDNRYIYMLPLYSAADGTTFLGYLVVSSSTSNLYAMIRTIIELFILTAVVILLIAVVISGFAARRQTRTLRELSAAAQQFAHGDFSARVSADDADLEMTELANAFNNMANELEKSESSRQTFISNVSHELKTPMTTIAGFMDGMLDGTIPESRYRYYMETVSNEVKRLNRMVRSMLEISRMQSTGEELKKARFDVTETLGRTLLTFEQKIEAKDLDVQVNMPDKAVYVMANEDAITQVIYNLIDNAVKFAVDETPLCLTVETTGSKALISVQNTGSSTIPAEELPLLFDRFHKSDKSRSLDTSGVGLGLYIVKTIVGSHGEDISVTSQNNVTTFTFSLTLTK